MSPLERRFTTALPPRLRLWYVMRLARRLVRQTYGGSRAIVRWRAAASARWTCAGRSSARCASRTAQPLCEFYAAAIAPL